jgi:hypothetical protein
MAKIYGNHATKQTFVWVTPHEGIVIEGVEFLEQAWHKVLGIMAKQEPGKTDVVRRRQAERRFKKEHHQLIYTTSDPL